MVAVHISDHVTSNVSCCSVLISTTGQVQTLLLTQFTPRTWSMLTLFSVTTPEQFNIVSSRAKVVAFMCCSHCVWTNTQLNYSFADSRVWNHHFACKFSHAPMFKTQIIKVMRTCFWRFHAPYKRKTITKGISEQFIEITQCPWSECFKHWSISSI